MTKKAGRGATRRRSRGRPIEFDRAAAVRAAMDEFWKRGFGAVSVSDLAAVMAITRSSFYNSFGDRESVFREALAAYRRTTPDRALAAIEPGQPVRPAVRKVFREICRIRAADVEGRGCLVVNAIGELVGVDHGLGKDVELSVRAAERAFAKLIAQAADQGEIARPRDARATARAFVVFMSGLNTISKVVRDEGDLWRLCEAFLDRFGFGREAAPR